MKTLHLLLIKTSLWGIIALSQGSYFLTCSMNPFSPRPAKIGPFVILLCRQTILLIRGEPLGGKELINLQHIFYQFKNTATYFWNHDVILNYRKQMVCWSWATSQSAPIPRLPEFTWIMSLQLSHPSLRNYASQHQVVFDCFWESGSIYLIWFFIITLPFIINRRSSFRFYIK